MSATVAIPARLASARLPRKVLLDLGGKTLLRRTHEVAVAAGCGPVVVLTDSEEVAEEVRSFGGEVMMTAADLESGTARIASVADELGSDVIVNLQGDAPLIDPSVVADAAADAARTRADVTMAVYRLSRPEDVLDPNVVKVVRTHSGRVLYCSRAAIPHVRDAPTGPWLDKAGHWGHCGIYAYTQDFLRDFAGLPVSPLEGLERLEQLRWLEAGLVVNSFEVPVQGPSVDTAADLQRVRIAFAEREQL
jgi:3-deoxy-manno-octulosonate cytidylyltransferase (CMP-KDO synthetase)